MKALNFINELRAQGRFSFTIAETENALGLKKTACLNALYRLKKDKWLVSPARGFYLIALSDWEKNPSKYNLTGEEKEKIKQFGLDSRSLLKGNKEMY